MNHDNSMSKGLTVGKLPEFSLYFLTPSSRIYDSRGKLSIFCQLVLSVVIVMNMMSQ